MMTDLKICIGSADYINRTQFSISTKYKRGKCFQMFTLAVKQSPVSLYHVLADFSFQLDIPRKREPQLGIAFIRFNHGHIYRYF